MPASPAKQISSDPNAVALLCRKCLQRRGHVRGLCQFCWAKLTPAQRKAHPPRPRTPAPRGVDDSDVRSQDHKDGLASYLRVADDGKVWFDIPVALMEYFQRGEIDKLPDELAPFAVAPRPKKPTEAVPGTEEKLAEMEKRRERRERLDHPNDADVSEREIDKAYVRFEEKLLIRHFGSGANWNADMGKYKVQPYREGRHRYLMYYRDPRLVIHLLRFFDQLEKDLGLENAWQRIKDLRKEGKLDVEKQEPGCRKGRVRGGRRAAED